MDIRGTKRRLKELERMYGDPDNLGFTLEELCRLMWRTDKESFRTAANKANLGFFLRQLELEDTDRRSMLKNCGDHRDGVR
jgi:hypothetical protein